MQTCGGIVWGAIKRGVASEIGRQALIFRTHQRICRKRNVPILCNVQNPTIFALPGTQVVLPVGGHGMRLQVWMKVGSFAHTVAT